MKRKCLSHSMDERRMFENNPEIEKEMIESAKQAQMMAYAPYSNFKVGAAILLEDGSIEKGCNVENASYGLAICAERVAMTSVIAKGKRDIKAICVISTPDQPAAPCGACRQFLAEFKANLPVLMVSNGGSKREMSLSELLPEQFDKKSLDKL